MEYLGLKPGEVMMAASHAFDLRAARMQGLMTGHINRPSENDVAKPGRLRCRLEGHGGLRVATGRLTDASVAGNAFTHGKALTEVDVWKSIDDRSLPDSAARRPSP